MTTIVQDSFTESTDTTLASHTGETGASWTLHTSYSAALIVKEANDELEGEATGSSAYYASGAPSGADYDVELDLTLNASSNASGGPTGRMSTSANTLYHVRFNDNSKAWQLYRWVTGSASLLGSYSTTLTTDQVYNAVLEMSGDQIHAIIDTVSRIGPITDTNITAAGKAGVRLYNGGAGDYNDMSFDNFLATEVAAGGATIPVFMNHYRNQGIA